jgi:hypothetical protein
MAPNVVAVKKSRVSGKSRQNSPVRISSAARTMALAPKTHNLYLVTAQIDATPVPEDRQVMVKDSFTVLIVGK